MASPANKHELKFVFHDGAAHVIRRLLAARCRPDGTHPAGTISSIYYDTRAWTLLNEKTNSDFLKTKIRLRWYADIDGENPGSESFLEAKLKIGARREKLRRRLDYSGAWLSQADLDDPRLSRIPDLLGEKRPAVPGQLFPAFTVRYKRWRFVEPSSGARVAIDHGICVPSVNRQMLPRLYPFRLSTAVLEVKGDVPEMPAPLHCLLAMGCTRQAFSKYAACHAHLLRTA